ncbi:MAG: restriction endonuclease [Saprospiraceae bacterium]
MHDDIKKYKVFNQSPVDWQDLQIKTSQILSDIGYACEIEKNIETVRGIVNVDVYAENKSTQPNQVLIAECKNWNNNIPKSVVHSFRTVISDSGANFGLIVSKIGFQEGAKEAAKKSNILLFSWEEFQEYFKLEWMKSMIMNVHRVGKPLWDFTDYMGDFYDKEFEQLEPSKKNKFIELKRKYSEFAFYSHKDFYLNYFTGEIEHLDKAIESREDKLPIEIKCYSDYFYFIRDYCKEGLDAIDEVFGKKVRK